LIVSLFIVVMTSVIASLGLTSFVVMTVTDLALLPGMDAASAPLVLGAWLFLLYVVVILRCF